MAPGPKSAKKTGKGIHSLMTDINKKEKVMATLSESDYDVERIPTGIMSLDHILRGGLPKGKIALAWGAEGGGKSAIATRFSAEAQKHGEVVYIDLENALDPRKAENSGIDMERLIVAQPSSAEEAMELIEQCLRADDVSAIIVDSVAAMATEAEIHGDYGDSHVGTLARLLSQGMRKINQFMIQERSDTIVFFTNQQREKIGGYGPITKTTPGGKALPYYSSTTMDVARIGNIEQGKEIIGQTSQVTLRKSRFAPPFQKAVFDIYFDSGINNESTIIDLAVKMGRLDKGKAGHYTDCITGEKIGHGKPKVIEYLNENPEYTQELSEYILTAER